MWSESWRCAGATALLALVLAPSEPLYAQALPEPEEDQAEPASGPRGVLRLFGAVEWGATDLPNTPNSFALGQLDLFLTAALTERTTILAEVVLEESTETRVVTDLERLQLTFRLDDHLQVSAGRYHTGIGFYNTAFHHGAWFETAIGRPRIFLFEDDGGVLPIHDVGLVARGAIPGTRSNLHYLFELGNGRSGATSDADREARDDNDAKALNGGIAFLPDRWRGLELGGSFRRDVVPQQGLAPIEERITALYAVYRTPATEVLAEWLTMAMTPRGGTRYRDRGGYVQISRSWKMARPYYRFDNLDVDADTPLIGHAGSYTAHVLGLRLDPAAAIGFKVQYERTDVPGHPRGDGVRTQLVFVF
jgi:hypothetical protein